MTFKCPLQPKPWYDSMIWSMYRKKDSETQKNKKGRMKAGFA